MVCRQLGSKDNGEAVLTSTPIYASLSSIERDYEIFFHILQCNGSESNIFDCVTDMRIVGVCKSNNILQINCKGSQISSGQYIYVTFTFHKKLCIGNKSVYTMVLPLRDHSCERPPLL